ncbi:DDE-type integrase/transposase/recombinase [Halorubraceae archaeon YAN]|nr:DDE-type integrase/transposase/recombinase [Halorubraceae archaeon YAN]
MVLPELIRKTNIRLEEQRNSSIIWHTMFSPSDLEWVHQVSDPPEVKPKRVGVDETAVKINGELCWVYNAIDLNLKLILMLNCSDNMALTRRLSFFNILLRNTVFERSFFSSTTSAIRLPLLD